MNINLYSCFNHWKHFNNIWIYSDPHFNDPDSKFFTTAYPGDEEQVKRINSKVGKKDLIIFLGDIGDVSFISQIRGYKVLIQGNHDTGATNYIRKKTYALNTEGKVCMIEDNKLFDEVYEGPIIIHEKVILSHEYLDISYFFNIHGHHHSKLKKETGFNCCAEHLNYTPISLKNIMESGALKKVSSVHRVTIDAATERKKKKTNNRS
jgi:calcineurin-like phosphoesterase family protein